MDRSSSEAPPVTQPETYHVNDSVVKGPLSTTLALNPPQSANDGSPAVENVLKSDVCFPPEAQIMLLTNSNPDRDKYIAYAIEAEHCVS